jgi:hypothetical protein
VRRSGRNEQKAAAASARAVADSPPARVEISDLVELARRMSIPDDDAIRGLLSRAMGGRATESTLEHR